MTVEKSTGWKAIRIVIYPRTKILDQLPDIEPSGGPRINKDDERDLGGPLGHGRGGPEGGHGG